jgi:predicted nuclease of predicted toxin-antitoxin system
LNFIVDAQLPPQLAMWIREQGLPARSLRELGLQCADDSTIWDLAKQETAIIVTKDEDFILLAAARPGPSVLWVRTGNLVNRLLLDCFRRSWPEVLAHLRSGARVVELR